jgi:hypothetical protein
MTTIAVPPAGSPAWRGIYPTPPDVRLDIPAGTWCPLDDTTLQIRLDGWGCSTCKAAWNFQGQAGRWLSEPEATTVHWRPSAVTMLAECAAIAAALVALLGTLDERLVWLLAAAIAIAAAAVPTYAWVARKIADFPYRHNRVIAVHDRSSRTLPAATRGGLR